jgi:hypothetical protein
MVFIGSRGGYEASSVALRGAAIALVLVTIGVAGCGDDAAADMTDSGVAAEDAEPSVDAAPSDSDAGAGADAGADAGPAGCTATTDELRVHYELDETSGTAASDSSGNGNDGTLEGSGGPNWVPGTSGNGLSFDDVDNRVSAAPNVSIDDLLTMTVCAWVHPRSYDDFISAVVDKSRNGLGGGWNFFLEDNQTFGLMTNDGDWAASGPTMLLAWQHICASWDGSTGTDGVFLYYNGVAVTPSDAGKEHGGRHSDASRNLAVGLTNDGAFALDGVIDDVRLYGRALTSAEVLTVYECGL